MAKYVLIGGRSTEYLTDFSLEEKILNRLNLNRPSILYFPFASSRDISSSIQKFRLLTKDSLCRISFLTDLEDTAAVEQAMDAADVLYFGGGCAEELVEIVRRSCLLDILKRLENSNKVLMGISAGAILLAKSGMGDRYAYKDRDSIYNYKMVEGIGLLDITVCPHYDHPGLWCYNDAVREFKADGIALEDDTAVLIGETIEAFKRDKKKSVYYFSWKKDYLMQALYEVEK